tara:strand:- start:2041 stop:2685 length:645 start_codon:yes stop_codon:yes gene_type:complete
LKNEYLYNMSSFIDPIKELPGPPSLSGNGLKFKSPTVDSPNVNLPSSIPKNLNPSSALKKSKILSIRDKSSGLQDKVGGLTGGLQDKASGLTGGLQDKASGLTGGLQDKAGGLTGGLQDKVGGLGANWSPEKFNPKKISGNSKFVNPINGKISDTKSLLQDKAGGLQDKAGGLTGGLQDKAGGLQDRLNDIKSDVPNPKVNVPIGERIRIIKIK